MGRFLSGILLPFFLLTAAVLDRSLVSLADLIAALVILYTAPKIDSTTGVVESCLFAFPIWLSCSLALALADHVFFV